MGTLVCNVIIQFVSPGLVSLVCFPLSSFFILTSLQNERRSLLKGKNLLPLEQILSFKGRPYLEGPLLLKATKVVPLYKSGRKK